MSELKFLDDEAFEMVSEAFIRAMATLPCNDPEARARTLVVVMPVPKDPDGTLYDVDLKVMSNFDKNQLPSLLRQFANIIEARNAEFIQPVAPGELN